MYKQIFDIGELEKIFNTNGIKYKRSGEWLMLCCPFHIEENPSFGINIFSGKYNCFACSVKGNFETLFAKLNIDDSVLSETEHIGFELLRNFLIKSKKKKNVINVDYHPIKFGDNKYYNYLKKRGVDDKIINQLEIGYIKNNVSYENRVVFPIYDFDGNNILWYEGRSIVKNIKNKYYRPKSSKSKNVIYNIHNCNRHYCIIVEGIFGVARISQLGYDAGCIFGNTISLKQINQLIKFTDVYFLLDSDKAGKVGMRKLYDFIYNAGFNMYLVIMKNGMDVDNLTKKELNKLLRKSILISNI